MSTAVSEARLYELRDDVEEHLRAAGVRPLLVAPAGIAGPDLNVILQSTLGEQELALEVVRQVGGVETAEFLTGLQARSIMRVTLHP